MPIDPDRSDDEVAAIVRDGYDTIADGYLASMRTTDANDPRSAWVGRFLDVVQAESRIIDIGCGPGVPTAAQLDAAGHRVVGVDISPRQVVLAQSEVPRAEFVAADIFDLHFDPGSFDATNRTNHYAPDTMLELVRNGGFSIDRREVISSATPFGAETWLWVLARASM